MRTFFYISTADNVVFFAPFIKLCWMLNPVVVDGDKWLLSWAYHIILMNIVTQRWQEYSEYILKFLILNFLKKFLQMPQSAHFCWAICCTCLAAQIRNFTSYYTFYFPPCTFSQNFQKLYFQPVPICIFQC